MGNILLKNIICEGFPKDIYIEGDKISRILPAGTESDLKLWHEASGIEVVECAGMAAVPGLVNMHTHAAMTMMRGVGEDIPFPEWIDRIWNVEEKIDDEYVYWGTKVACLEMIKTGTTAFNDQYWHVPAAQKAAAEMGMRSVHSYVILDKNDPETACRQKAECEKIYEMSRFWPKNSSFAVAFHAVYSVSTEMMLWASEFARSNGLKLHIHLSETQKEVDDCIRKWGKSPVALLDELGILGPEVIAAHTLWLSDEDIEILGKRGVTCVHNINSNLKLSSGYKFKYNELKSAGANICIGTDGCASSNNLDLLEAMKTSAIVQKAWRNDPAALPLDALMAAATANGAKALGIDSGRLEEGSLADILIVDTDNTFFLSNAPFLANFVYSAHSDCIVSSICGGRFLMRNRKVAGEKEILASARRVLAKLP